MPAYDKVGGSLYQRQRMFVDVGNAAYPVERAYVKVGGSLYEFFSSGGIYALLETGDNDASQTTLYTIDRTTGVLTQVGLEQTLGGGVSAPIGAIGTFVVDSVAYALLETGASFSTQTTLYTIELTTGVLTQVGLGQTFVFSSSIAGIGTFVVNSTAYALVESDTRQTTLLSIDLTTGLLTTISSRSLPGVGGGNISALDAFAVGSTAYALVETSTNVLARARLYTIDLTTSALTQVGDEQTLAGVPGPLGAIGTFVVDSIAYVLLETGQGADEAQTTLYTIELTTGVLTQVGLEQTFTESDSISGIGTFAV